MVPRPEAPPGTDCDDPNDRNLCMNVFEPDGELDTGYYYAQGGQFKYDAFALQVGIRYTF